MPNYEICTNMVLARDKSSSELSYHASMQTMSCICMQQSITDSEGMTALVTIIEYELIGSYI